LKNRGTDLETDLKINNTKVMIFSTINALFLFISYHKVFSSVLPCIYSNIWEEKKKLKFGDLGRRK